MRLHSFRHKNYWYQGTRRERPTMIALAQLLHPGDVAMDVGAHIGYLSVWMSSLVGANGVVVVCEPGANNLPYLRKNVAALSNVQVREIAIAESSGNLQFLEEDLSGQNNTLVTEGEHFHTNMELAGVAATSHLRTVEALPLDEVVAAMDAPPNLVKIDVEGAELAVVKGACGVLEDVRPIWVIEVTHDREEIGKLFDAAGYAIYYPNLEIARGFDRRSVNFVCLHREAHRAVISALGGAS